MKQRIITATIALAVFLPIVIYGGLPFIAVMYLIATIGLYELLRMKRISILSFPGVISILMLWVILVPDHPLLLDRIPFMKVEFLLFAVLLFLSYTVLTNNKFSFDDVGFIIVATLYVGIGFYYFIETRQVGLTYIFFAFAVIFSTDSGAYFVGRKFGKHKLWPEISPNKTIEGSIGGIACALIAAVLFKLFAPIDDFTMISILGIAIVLSIFGQIGDLVESAFKRHYAVKDSGRILPGHGGILDRFDSLIFVLPILYFLIKL
ncbi:phosphatidate cytidylyltransferase [Cytobacillus sp. IB215665]|uniref:phosphatidate cytidylyltransferase n=1 Tax=Cytobacillus sp. IB215665 TaxID=3097357 RepID=UPI002A0DBB1C|nr:phosphatidate cytidylyltransferase [Cytobacillus sp. IB215665]MDX8365097.1 phosphatidate cytidylyltransferase [Cytobacillus sp. IB215665]